MMISSNKHTSTVRCLWQVSGFRVLQTISYLLKSYIWKTSIALRWLPKLTHSFVVHFDFRLSSSYRLFREIDKNKRSKNLLTTNLLCLHQRRPLRRTREDAPITIKAGQSSIKFGSHFIYLFICLLFNYLFLFIFIYLLLFIYYLFIYYLFTIYLSIMYSLCFYYYLLFVYLFACLLIYYLFIHLSFNMNRQCLCCGRRSWELK